MQTRPVFRIRALRFGSPSRKNGGSVQSVRRRLHGTERSVQRVVATSISREGSPVSHSRQDIHMAVEEKATLLDPPVGAVTKRSTGSLTLSVNRPLGVIKRYQKLGTIEIEPAGCSDVTRERNDRTP
jgi:hypothetical protein